MRTYIIAEAGDNHNGDVRLAYRLIDAAKEAGADAVKFQTFVTEDIISKFAEMAEYQKQNTCVTESQFDMVKKLELSFEQFSDLKKYCDDIGITFLTTPFDVKSLRFITDKLNVKAIKIPSGEITNYPYLVECAKTRLPIILSTGMADIAEIRSCIEVLESNGANEIVLLHCTTQYPAPPESVNLLAMKTLEKEFQKKVGYSDHTLGTKTSELAVAMGAAVIEKHFTLDKNLPGPDHKASLEPEELKELVLRIRQVEIILGNGVKLPQEAEIPNIAVARKSIVAAREIREGEILSVENLGVKRPGSGLSPMLWNKILGKKAIRNFEKDELIEI